MAVHLGQGRNFNPRAPLAQRNQMLTGGVRSLYGQSANNLRVMTSKFGINNELIQMAELRIGQHDYHLGSFLVRKSSDFGYSWEPAYEVLPLQDTDAIRRNIGALSEPDAAGLMDFVYVYWDEYVNLEENPGPVMVWHATVVPPYDKPSCWSEPADISDQVVKTSNAAPANLPSFLQRWDDYWRWCIPTWSCTILSGPNAGIKLFVCVVRYNGTTPTPGERKTYSRVYVFAKLLDGSFVPWGGSDEFNDTYNDMKINEAAIAINGSGHVKGAFRSVDGSSGGESYTHLGTSTDDGVNWSFVRSGQGGTTELRGADCQRGLASDPTNRDIMYLTQPSDSSARYYGKLFRSEDGGITWPKSATLYDGPFGYSNVHVSPDGRLLIGCFEGTHNYTNNTYANAYQKIFNFHALASDPQTGGKWNPITFYFNELPAGRNTLPGFSGFDYGGGDVRFKYPSGWTYASDGVISDGTGYLSIVPRILGTSSEGGNTGGALALRDDSFVMEIVLDCTNLGASKGIVSDRNTAVSQVGYTLQTTSDKYLQFFGRNPAGTEVTITGTIPVDFVLLEQPCRIRLVRDRANSKFHLYLNDIEQGTEGGTTDTLGGIFVNSACNIGALGTGSGVWPADVKLVAFRFSRGVASVAEVLTASPTKIDPKVYIGGYNPDTSGLTLPSSHNDCVLWLESTTDGGFHVSDDIYEPVPGGIDLPIGTNSTAHGMICAKTGKFYTCGQSPSLFRNAMVDYDTTVGMHFFHGLQGASGTSPPNWCRPVDTAFNFFHQNAIFFIQFNIMWLSNSGQQYLFTTMHNTNANPGLFIRRETTQRLTLNISPGGGSPRISYLFTKAFSAGVWYQVGLWGTGDAQPLRLVWGQYPGNLAAPSSYTHETSGATVVGGDDNSTDLTQPIIFYSANNDGNPTGCRSKELVIRNTAPADNDEAAAWMAEIAELVVFKPSNPALLAAMSRGFF